MERNLSSSYSARAKMKIARKLLTSYYLSQMRKAREKLRTMPLNPIKIKINFKQLHICPKIDATGLYVDPADEGLSTDLYAWGFREPINTYMLHKFILEERENIDAIVDIGSNIGYFPLVELTSNVRQIFAVEPNLKAFIFLKRNVGHFKNVKMLNIAVSDKKENVRMYIPAKMNLATILKEAALRNIKVHNTSIKEVIEVPALPLSEIIKSEDLVGSNILIRMDVEGFEKIILKNLPKEVYAVSFEIHPDLIGKQATLTLLKDIVKYGYKIKVITNGTIGLYPLVKWFGLKSSLWLFEKATRQPRIFYEPSFSIINKLMVWGGHTHIFAKRI